MSGFGLFMGGVADTLDTGLDVAESMEKFRTRNTGRKLSRLLGEMENYDPYAASGTLNPSSAAIPDSTTVSARNNPKQGFSGEDFADLQKQYFREMGNLASFDEYGKAREAFGVMRTSKINESLDQAIMAYDSGDPEMASEFLRSASAYISPGTTPEIGVDPNSGAFMVLNYDSKTGEPKSGYAMTRDQLVDFRSRNTDWNAWADREQRDAVDQEQLKISWDRLQSEKDYRTVQTQLNKDAAQRQAELDALEAANRTLEGRKLTSEAEVAEATQAGEIEKTNAKNFVELAAAEASLEKLPYETEAAIATAEGTTAAQREIKRTEGDKQHKETMEFVNNHSRYSRQDAEKILAERGSGVNMPAAMAALVGGESSGDPGAVSNKGAQGLGQIMPANIAPWAREVLGGLVEGMSDEQIRQLYASNPDFQYQLASAKFSQLVQKHGLQDAFSIWHSGRPLAQAVAENANDGSISTENYVANMMDRYAAAGGAGTTVSAAAPEAPSEMVGGGHLDELGRYVEEEDEKGEKVEYILDPWFYEEPNENGEVYLRDGLASAMSSMSRDIIAQNEHATPEASGAMILAAFGRDPTAELGIDEDSGQPFITNGIDKFRISEDTYGNIADFRETNAQALMDMAPGNKFPTAQGWTTAQATPAIPEDIGRAPDVGSAVAGPVIRPPVDPILAATAADTGIPVPPQAASPAPPATYTPPRPPAPDDTAIVTPQAQAPSPEVAASVQAGPTISQIPELARVVAEWRAAGMPPEGLRVIAQMVDGLPPQVQTQVASEIRAMQGITGNPEFR